MATVALETTTTPTVQEDIQELRRIFQDDFVSARDYFREVYARHGDAPELAYWKGILMPGKLRVTHGNKPMRDLMPDFNWIKMHAHAYYGQFLALYDGELLAHGSDRKQVSAEAHGKVDSDQILIFPCCWVSEVIEPLDRMRLLTDWPAGRHTLLVGAVNIGDSEIEPVLLDIGSEHCVISRTSAEDAGWVSSPDLEPRWISTRLGSFCGVIDRMDVSFPGVTGEHLTIDATWLIIDEWPGPTVYGWRGGLDRMCFAVDPLDNWFYFAAA